MECVVIWNAPLALIGCFIKCDVKAVVGGVLEKQRGDNQHTPHESELIQKLTVFSSTMHWHKRVLCFDKKNAVKKIIKELLENQLINMVVVCTHLDISQLGTSSV